MGIKITSILPNLFKKEGFRAIIIFYSGGIDLLILMKNTIILPKTTYYFADSFWMIFVKRGPILQKINISLRTHFATKKPSFCRFCGRQQKLLTPGFLYRICTTEGQKSSRIILRILQRKKPPKRQNSGPFFEKQGWWSTNSFSTKRGDLRPFFMSSRTDSFSALWERLLGQRPSFSLLGTHQIKKGYKYPLRRNNNKI